MGCPDVYYKEAMQQGCYARLIFKDKERAKSLKREQNIGILEKAIEELNDGSPSFYFDMGMAAGALYQDVYDNEGTDGFNACLGGISMFETLVKGEEDD